MTALKPLLNWYHSNKRDLPWRNTEDPYLIWLSEVILQQTRVEQGLPYFEKFAQTYPNVKKLAAAKEKDIMKLWQGLGYYSRAINMHHTAKLVVKLFNGEFPFKYDDLISLKGVGPYTAAAVSSFSANEPHAVLDGNVFRVISRLFEIKDPINSTNGRKIFSQIANEILDKKHPATHNQAIMELGALVCTPRNPKCPECVLRLSCYAYKNKSQTSFPVKIKKLPPRSRYFNYLIIKSEGSILITQRKDKDIWSKLFEPPLIESEKEFTSEEVKKQALTMALCGKLKTNLKKCFSARHQLTHQTIFADFWLIEIPGKKTLNIKKTGFERVLIADLHQYAVHRLFDKFLNSHTLQA